MTTFRIAFQHEWAVIMANHKVHEPIASNVYCCDCDGRVESSNLIFCPFWGQLAKVGQIQHKPTNSDLHAFRSARAAFEFFTGFVISFGDRIIEKLNEPRDKTRAVPIY